VLVIVAVLVIWKLFSVLRGALAKLRGPPATPAAP